MDHVWQYAFYTDTSTVTVHIRRLRAKLEPDPETPRWIETVWGVGYRFAPVIARRLALGCVAAVAARSAPRPGSVYGGHAALRDARDPRAARRRSPCSRPTG